MKRLAFIVSALAVQGLSPSAGAASCPDGALHKGASPPDGGRIWCEDSSAALHGPMTAWHDSGELKVRGRYDSGKKSGKWLYFFEDGLPRASGQFLRGRMEGLWTWWFSNGRSSEEGELLEGLEEGPWVFWHRNGRVSESGVMREGFREGWWRQWTNDGLLGRMAQYEQGVEVEQRQEDSSRYRGFGGLYSCWGYGCGSWYRHCYAGWCDPYWDPYYRGYGGSYYGGYPVYRGHDPRRSSPPGPGIPPSGLKPAKRSRKSYGPPPLPQREHSPARKLIDPSPEAARRRRP